MVYIFILVSGIITFIFGYYCNTYIPSKEHLIFDGYIIHHSCFGILLIIAGAFVVLEPVRSAVLGIGFGMYLSHVIEEVYFVNTSVWLAPFVFITKLRPINIINS